MTALTIDIDDRLIDALRETAARRHTTVDAVVRDCVEPLASGTGSRGTEPEEAHGSFRHLAGLAPLRFEAGRTWSREDTHDRPVLR